MSKGYGIVQRKIAALFESNPNQKFPIRKLVELVFETPCPTRTQYVAVSRAAKKVAADQGWMSGSGRRYRRKIKSELQTREEFFKANSSPKSHSSVGTA